MTTIPTIAQLKTDVLADIQAEYGVTINPLLKWFLVVVAYVQAARLRLLYLYLGRIQKNIFADTADPEAAGGTLERFGRVKLGRNPYAGTQGIYDVAIVVTGTGSIPAGTTFKSDDSSRSPGLLYVLDTAASVDVGSSASATLSLRALTTGTGAKLDVTNTLTATAPLIVADEGGTVSAETTAPIDDETIEDYRTNILQSFRLYPQGGASADYRLWGSEAGGVKQIYPYTSSGASGEVDVYVEANVADSTDGKGTPTTGIKADVTNALEADTDGNGRHPLGVFAINVLDVVINDIDITISGAGSISAANRTLIENALTDAVNAVRPFIAGADVVANKNDTFGHNQIINSILQAVPGSIFSGVSMVITAGGVPATVTSRTYVNGNIPWLASVTWA